MLSFTYGGESEIGETQKKTKKLWKFCFGVVFVFPIPLFQPYLSKTTKCQKK